MKKLSFVLALVLSLAATADNIAFAASKSVTLAVENMTCPVCPITVRKALENVAGVSKASVSFEKKEAVVTFDDGKTNVDQLTKATTDAGYPSTVKGASKQ